MTRRGSLKQVYDEGVYWIGFGYRIHWFDKTIPIKVDEFWQLIIANSILSERLHLVRIEDYELEIELREGSFHRILEPGIYGYWNEDVRYEVMLVDTRNPECDPSLPTYMLRLPDIQKYLLTIRVESYQRGVLYIDGVKLRTVEAGLYSFWRSVKLPEILKVDTRVQTLELTDQEILTKDKAGIRVTSVSDNK